MLSAMQVNLNAQKILKGGKESLSFAKALLCFSVVTIIPVAVGVGIIILLDTLGMALWDWVLTSHSRRVRKRIRDPRTTGHGMV